VRVPIRFPLGGLSDDKAYSAQEPGTTPDAVNVRAMEPSTGRERGGQRAGMTKYLSAVVGNTDKMVQDLTVITRDAPKIQFANLTTGNLVDDESPWPVQTPEGGTVPWVALDLSENVYVLDAGSAIHKYNSDGVKLRTIAIPVPEDHTVVNKLEVDADGGVYAASYHETDQSGRVWRFVDSQTSSLELELDWEHEIDGAGVEMFGGNLYAIWYIARYATGQRARRVVRLDSITAGPPTESVISETAGPVNGLEVGPDNSLKLAIGEGLTKGAGAERNNFTKQEVSDALWSPHDLNDAENRLYFWLDSTTVDGEGNATLSDGDEVTVWKDRRHWDTVTGGGTGGFAEVNDKTVRDLFKAAAGASGEQRSGPTFKENVFGELPGIYFNAGATAPSTTDTPLTGSALRSYANGSVTAKTAASDSLPDQRAVFPGYTGASYITCIVVKPFLAQTSRHFLSQSKGSGALDIGFFSSCYYTGTAYELSRGEMVYHDKSSTTGISNAALGAGTDHPHELNYDNDCEAMIMTIVHNGATNTGSWFRCNGEYVDEFTFGDSTSYSASASFTLIGCRRSNGDDASTGDLYTDSDTFGASSFKLASFTGYIAEIITVLADTKTNPHDAWIDVGEASKIGGYAGKWEAARDPSVASEVELLEGYLAHKWGLSHLLPGYSTELASANGTSSQTGTAISLMDNHPFGGTGSWPIRPEYAVDNLDKALAWRAAWRPEPVVARYAPGSSKPTWAAYGSGLGDAVVTSDENRCLSIGIKPNWDHTENPLGIDFKTETTVIARCIRDMGSRYGDNRPARGFVSLVSQVRTKANAFFVPSDGVTVTINDGQGNTVVFEFDAADPSNGNTWISTASGAAETVMGLFITAVGASALEIDAYYAGPYTVALVNQNDGVSGNQAITTNTSAEVIVYGMVDGDSQTSVWTLTDASYEPSQPGVGLAVDDNGDFWIPWLTSNVDNRVDKRDGTDGSSLVTYDLDATQSVYCVALPLSHPAYIDQSGTPTGPLYMYLGSSGGELATQLQTLWKVRIISETQSLAGGSSPRTTYLLGVSEGLIYTITSSASTDISTGAGVTLLSTSPYIQSTTAFDKVFWCDGTQYATWDSQTGVLEQMTSKAAGSLPKNGKLITQWRGRLVIGRTEDTAGNVYMSRVGNPFDWDEFPAVPDGLEAVSFANSRVGLSSDIVNALIPYNDDLLIVGGDHTIQRLSGDPAFGGQLDLISDTIGIAYGEAWCKDAEGRLYFFGTQGGVYVMVPGSQPLSLTQNKIEGRLVDLDLSTYRIRLVWNQRALGLHVFAIPLAQPTLDVAPAVRSWFMDKNGAWWEDEFAATNVAPTAVVTLDGDTSGDRVLLLGGGDGHLRYWDETAVNDDGYRIDSRISMLLVPGPDTTQRTKILRPQVALATGQGGADFKFYASDTAERKGNPVAEGKLGPGMNPTLPVRARGSACWLELRNAQTSERWAFERATVDVASGGRERVG
jgi:uncharacterized membrane protein